MIGNDIVDLQVAKKESNAGIFRQAKTFPGNP